MFVTVVEVRSCFSSSEHKVLLIDTVQRDIIILDHADILGASELKEEFVETVRHDHVVF